MNICELFIGSLISKLSVCHPMDIFNSNKKKNLVNEKSLFESVFASKLMGKMFFILLRYNFIMTLNETIFSIISKSLNS